MKKRRDKSVRSLTALLALLFLVTGILAVYLWQQEKQEDRVFCYLVEREGGISDELFRQLEVLPGLQSAGQIWQVQVSVKINEYQTEGQFRGVDLETYPLQLIRSAGEVAYGHQVLVVPTEGLLESMTDYNGSGITARQKELLLSQMETCSVQLGENTPGKLIGVSGQKEAVLYGDREQARQLAQREKKEIVKSAWIIIQGKENAAAAAEALEKVGHLNRMGAWLQ